MQLYLTSIMSTLSIKDLYSCTYIPVNMRYSWLVVFALFTNQAFCQDRDLKVTTGLILNHSAMQLLDADEGFRQKDYRAGYRLGLTYDHYFRSKNKNSIGFRTGIYLVKKR